MQQKGRNQSWKGRARLKNNLSRINEIIKIELEIIKREKNQGKQKSVFLKISTKLTILKLESPRRSEIKHKLPKSRKKKNITFIPTEIKKDYREYYK